MRYYWLIYAIAPAGAMSCAVGETQHFACVIGTKTVEVCHDDNTARYSFGPAGGTSDLQITKPVTEVDLTPWPGIGRTIWEELTFHNAGHSYTVHASIDRAPPEDETDDIVVTVFGGIIVRRGEEEIADLTCDPGTVDFPWGHELFDAKEAAGQCYDPGTRGWLPCENAN